MRLHQRAADGFPVGADQCMREGFGPIPDADLFQHHSSYRYEKPDDVFGWQWSTTFNRWSAKVKFKDGWEGFTWPAPWRKHHNDCPVCGTTLTRHSPNGFDVIYECDGHHRHIIKGITGEYISMHPMPLKG